jgi:hypothetical protein
MSMKVSRRYLIILEESMRKSRLTVFIILFSLIVGILGCAPGSSSISNGYKDIATYTRLLKENESDAIISKYTINSESGFCSAIDFEITKGKVEWEITNPKGEIVFKGHVVSENGKTYRQLTEPLTYLSGRYSKQEVPSNEIDFSYLQFEVGSIPGEYRLVLIPEGAEGSFLVEWRGGLPRK